jgi:hypothetical protein
MGQNQAQLLILAAHVLMGFCFLLLLFRRRSRSRDTIGKLLRLTRKLLSCRTCGSIGDFDRAVFKVTANQALTWRGFACGTLFVQVRAKCIRLSRGLDILP